MSAPRVIVRAVPGLRQIQADRVYQQNRGHTIELRWKGTEAECQSGLDALVFAGGVSEARIQPGEGGFFTLSVTYATSSASDPGGSPPTGPEAVTTIWDRESSLHEKTLWNLGPVRDALSVLNESNRAAFRARMEAFWRNEITAVEWDKFVAVYATYPGVTAQMLDDLKHMNDAFAAGTEAYGISFFQFRRTQVGPPGQLINNDASEGSIWSRDTLISDPSMPDEFKVRVPPGYFLQKGSRISILDNKRWQIITEWDHGDAFNTWIHGAPL